MPSSPNFLVLLVLLLAVAAVPGQAQSTPARQPGLRALQSAEEAMRRGNVTEAEGDFQRAIQASTRLGPAYLGLGLIQLRRGQLAEATSSLTKATEFSPKLQDAHLFLGMVEYQQGDLVHAEASLRAELALRPDSVEALTWIGITEVAAGHAEAAVASLDRAASPNPGDPNLLYYRGRAHSMVAEAVYRQIYD